MRSLGGVPQLLIAADAVETGPDEAVAAVLLAHLFARVMELSTQTRAARLIQLSGCARGKRCVDPWKLMKQCVFAIRMQRRRRSSKQRADARAELRSRVVLSRAVGAWRDRVLFLESVRATRTIQAAGRRRRAVARLSALRAAALALQHFLRRQAARSLAARASTRIQSAARMLGARRRLQVARLAMLELGCGSRPISI